MVEAGAARRAGKCEGWKLAQAALIAKLMQATILETS